MESTLPAPGPTPSVLRHEDFYFIFIFFFYLSFLSFFFPFCLFFYLK